MDQDEKKGPLGDEDDTLRLDRETVEAALESVRDLCSSAGMRAAKTIESVKVRAAKEKK